MKKTFFIILLLIGCSQAQYSHNYNPDEGFDAPGDWSITAGWTVAGSVANPNGSTATSLYRAIDLDPLTTYRVEVDIVNYVANKFAIKHSSSLYANFDPPVDQDGYYSVTFTTTGATYDFILLFSVVGNMDIENLEYRAKLDTLWTDSAQADDTDNDSTKTPQEAVNIRGSHSGGYFDWIGTLTGKVTFDSSFTKLYSSQTATMDTVDFNNVTATVDQANLSITTKLNDSNVTYLNASTVVRGFPYNPGWPGWPKD